MSVLLAAEVVRPGGCESELSVEVDEVVRAVQFDEFDLADVVKGEEFSDEPCSDATVPVILVDDDVEDAGGEHVIGDGATVRDEGGHRRRVSSLLTGVAWRACGQRWVVASLSTTMPGRTG